MTAQEFDVATTAIPEGRALIEASAGTGKTYTIAGLFVRMVAELDLEVSEILVVTFTEAATAELVARIRAALQNALDGCESPGTPDDALVQQLREQDLELRIRRLKRALRDFDQVGISTIHGFCRRVIERAAMQAGMPFQAELLTEAELLRRSAVEDFWRRVLQGGDPRIARFAIGAKWTVAKCIKTHEELRKFSGVRVHPEARPLSDVLADLDSANLLEVFDAERLRALLEPVSWNAGKSTSPPLGIAEPSALVAHIESLLHSGAQQAVARTLSAKDLLPRIKKRSKADKNALAAVTEALAADPFLSACQRLHAAQESLDSALRDELLTDVDARFQQEKDRAVSLTFDDLLGRVRAALDDEVRGPRLAAALGRSYRAVLVDEFQDTDDVQWGIFERAFGDGRLLMIGDPKQAIYGFRGADLHTYLRARETAPERFTLRANYRSRQELLDALNTLFDHPNPFAAEGLDFVPVHAGRGERADRLRDSRDGSLHWLQLGDSEQRVKPRVEDVRHAGRCAVVGEIARLLKEARLVEPDRAGDDDPPSRPLRAADIGILVRTRQHAVAMHAALSAVGIPAAIGKGQQVFASAEMHDLLRIVAAVAHPRDQRALHGALTTVTWGADLTELEELHADGDRLDRVRALFETCRREWQRHGFVRAIYHLLDRRGVRPRLAGLESGARRLTNLLQSIEVLQDLSATRGLGPDSLIRAASDPELRAQVDGDAAELRLETDRDAVRIMTMHSAKGLQFPVVFCPSLWDAKKPNHQHGDVLRWHDESGRVHVLRKEAGVPDDELKQATGRHHREQLAESMRLAYVALTRAEQRVYVVIPEQGDATKNSPLEYLLQLEETSPAECLEALCTRAGGSMVSRRIPLDGARLPPAVQLEATSDDSGWQVGTPPRADERFAPWRTTSFTGLTRGAVEHEEGRDHADPPAADTVSEPAAAAAPTGLHAFARGAEAGTCLHRVLERIDFSAPEDRDAEHAMVAEELRLAGLADRRRHGGELDPQQVVTELVSTVRDAPLPDDFGAGCRLADLGAGQSLAEWTFHLQMASSEGRPQTAAELRGLFEAHGDDLAKEYAPRLDLLAADQRGSALRGYLTGSIDLLAALPDGRHWIFDWKSNHLGNDAEAYHPDALQDAMFEHHYVLQYHLYTLAVHRHLAARIPGYDYDSHMGGAGYAFLRGLRPAGGAPGWFVGKPPKTLIEALDELFGWRAGERP